jgi:hypothetical protein
MEGKSMTAKDARGLVNKLASVASIGPVTFLVTPKVENAGSSWSDNSPNQGIYIAPTFLETPGAPLILAHEVAHLVFRNPVHERDEQEEIAADNLGAKLLQKAGYPLPSFEDLVEVYWLAPFPTDRLANLGQILPRGETK